MLRRPGYWSRAEGRRISSRSLSFSYYPPTNAVPTEMEVLKWLYNSPQTNAFVKRMARFFTDAELHELSKME